MRKTFMFIAALVVAALFAGTSASAGVQLNGLQLNGTDVASMEPIGFDYGGVTVKTVTLK